MESTLSNKTVVSDFPRLGYSVDRQLHIHISKTKIELILLVLKRICETFPK